jgi:Spy/CpxP family protein refolding chaperone
MLTFAYNRSSILCHDNCCNFASGKMMPNRGKNMIRKISTTLTMVMMLTAIGFSAAAKQHPESGGDRERHRGHERMRGDFSADPAHMVEMMNRHLDLDEIQSQTISNILQAVKPEGDSLRERSRINHEALRALDVNDGNYDATLLNLSVQSGELAAERTRLRGRVRGEIHAVLTVEQQQKMADRVGRMESRRHHRAEGEMPVE